MEPIHNVAILGAGAMGAYFASRFYDAEGISVSFVARGERYERLRRDGLVVNDTAYPIPVSHPDQATAPADLILVALKHHHLPAAVHDLRGLVGEQTTLLSVMNGLDSEEILGRAYGPEKVRYAVSVGIDAVRQDNRISYTKGGTHYFGEATNDELSLRVRRVQAAFKQASIAYQTPPDMMRLLWWKFMVNVGLNQASAVMRAPYGVFQTSARAQAVMETLMREVIALAGAAGVNLVEEDVAEWVAVLQGLSPQAKTSMLQDIEAGRKTEVEAFGGKVVELGQTYGIPTPVNGALLSIILVLEQQAERQSQETQP